MYPFYSKYPLTVITFSVGTCVLLFLFPHFFVFFSSLTDLCCFSFFLLLQFQDQKWCCSEGRRVGRPLCANSYPSLGKTKRIIRSWVNTCLVTNVHQTWCRCIHCALVLINIKTIHRGVNWPSKYVAQVQQRLELPTVNLIWHACKYKVHKLVCRFYIIVVDILIAVLSTIVT